MRRIWNWIKVFALRRARTRELQIATLARIVTSSCDPETRELALARMQKLVAEADRERGVR
jgi:hypothetical protein